jgi:hypothetical protein
MNFKDPWNPEPEEIIEWANSNDPWPEQDFDLAVITGYNDELLFGLAKDQSSPKRVFFIHVLYLMVGDSVHGKEELRQYKLKNFISEKDTSSDPELEKWKKESLELLDGKLDFNYDYWCSHSFSN